jgi:two-component sensor histidine kinase
VSGKKPKNRYPWPRNLRAKIGVLLVAAALPAAVLSIASAIKLHGSTVDLNNISLLDNATGVARRVEDEISEAGKLARLLAALPGVRAETDMCASELQILVENFAVVSAAALVRPDGSLACAAGLGGAEQQALLAVAGGTGEQLTIEGALGAVSIDISGRQGWRLAVARPLASPIEAAIDAVGQRKSIAVVDRNWTPVVASMAPDAWYRSQESLPALETLQAATTVVATDAGASYRVAVAPVRNSSLFALAYRSDAELFEQETAVLMGSIAGPLLMIVFAVIAAWFGIDRLALRWIVYLRRITEAYGAGRTSVRASHLERAPAELAALGAAFNRMAEAVGERTEHAEHQSRARGLLLRELHHRIKNVFQLIASLISLQKREATPEIAMALSAHERRVGALSAAYRVSYAEGEIGPVGLGPLLDELCEVIARHGERPWASIDLRLADDLPAIHLDRAVPAALLITKLADARIVGCPADRARIGIEVRASAGMVSVDIEGGRPDASATVLSMRLRDAFAAQLGATVSEAEDGARTTVRFAAHADGPEAGGVPSTGLADELAHARAGELPRDGGQGEASIEN